MSIANEIEFENDICSALVSGGWHYSQNDSGYDRERALFPEDALEWTKDSQPDAWAKLLAAHGPNAEDEFINRLTKVLAGEGSLRVLRQGFKIAGAGGASFSMAQFKPAFGFNDEIAAKYQKNRLRVMRQVHYSPSNQNSIDLVLFVNGLSIATLELKTDFTQSVEDAKQQYRKDRPPKDPSTHKEEPLLTFKRGALVHFAVSCDEVWMTTRLADADTFFLPFNKGFNGGKGNPPNPEGYPTSYLWEDIFQRDSWLRILGSFIQFTSQTRRGADGVKKTTESIIFPRYHQLDAVTKLIDAARIEGAGHTYLFQHSAGSGKSNTIGWCAHQLATLHDAQDNKIFSSVIVITDRTVLDAQLKETISQFEATPGVVAAISGNEGAKSGQLAKALKKGALIIVVTLQTFPFVLQDIKESAEGLTGKTFAVIIDEAHSSQSGASARQLRGVLSAQAAVENGDSATETGEDEEITTEDLLLAEASTRVLPKNASFLAFTATPKTKTLEVFGRPENPNLPASKTNPPRPFHLYTMRQAIEEGFILDVLQNYTPYKMAYKLAHGGQDWDSGGEGNKDSDVALVDKPAALKALHRWVRLHPYNIAQKVEIVVEHFRASVGYRLDGRAKAMVVTASRPEAVRYKLAMDDYIRRSGYTDVAALVAFSDDVIDPTLGPEKFNESTMNPQLRGRDIRTAFATDEYNVLIVANKFQTGFDQPLLVAMYVDKRLDGITAVQTLSRLNRILPGKDSTFVLDFVNDADTIRLAFEPYYEATELINTTDPNLVYDLQSKLDAEQLYTEEEARDVAAIFIGYQMGGNGQSKKGQKELIAALSAPVERFKTRWMEAEHAKDKEAIDALTTFHKNLGAFNRLYDFLSQIVSYEDSGLEARYILYRHLEPLIAPDRVRSPIDLSEVSLSHYKLRSSSTLAIDLGLGEDSERALRPITAVGTHAPRDPEQVRLDELVQQLNTLFDDGTLTDADRVGLFHHVAGKMMESEEIAKQARANTKAQFKQSPTISNVVVDAVIAAMDSYETMGKKVFQDAAAMERFKAMLVEHVYHKINAADNSSVATQ